MHAPNRPSRWRAALVGAAALAATVLPAAPAAAADAEVEIAGFTFTPAIVTVGVGESVTWTNSDPEPHTATAEDGSFNSDIIPPGGTYSETFEEEGAFPYFCQIHPEMTGQVLVGDAQPAPGLGEPSQPYLRLPGGDNVDDAIAISSTYFEPGSVDVAVLARSDLFADSLSSGPVQGLFGAPLLLTPPGVEDPRVAAELDRLGTTRVIVFGGEAAGVQGYGRDVERISGPTRLETAIAAAQQYYGDATSAYLVRGADDPADPTRAFADSLAAGAAAANTGTPILLSQTEVLSESTANYLRSSAIETVVMVGGTGALSAAVEQAVTALGKEVIRVSGPNRFATAAFLAYDTLFRVGRPLKGVIYLEGTTPDAWAAGFAAASLGGRGAYVQLTAGEDLPVESTQVALLAPGAVTFICGPDVEDSACQQAEIARSSQIFGPGSVGVMTPDEEVPGPGLEGASGVANIAGSGLSGDALCYFYSSYGAEPTAAHIHRGAPGEAGPPVVPLTTVNAGEPGFYVGCAFELDPALVQEILEQPQGFYVNVHTAEHPQGAIRGQLFTPQGPPFEVGLSGGEEVPGPGDEDGFGFAAIFVRDATTVCVDLTVGEIDTVTAAHIHRGAPGEAGPPVAPLPIPSDIRGDAVAGCVGDLDEALVSEIQADPAAFYVNVHTEAFPDGALRGQLPEPQGEGPPPGGAQGDGG